MEIALFFLRGNRPKEALEYLLRAREIDPDHEAVLERLSQVMQRMNRPDEAAQCERRLKEVRHEKQSS